MHIIIAGIFFITLLLAFYEDYLKDTQKFVLLCLYAFVFIFLATTKDVDSTADAANYEDMFNHNDNPLQELYTEPSFTYLSRIVQFAGGEVGVLFFIYAIITIPGKIYALSKMTSFIFSAMLIYVPIYFEVHDMIQIRAAAAATFLFLSILLIVERRRAWAFLLMVIAILFHYSSIAFLPFILIGNMKLNSYFRIAIAFLVPIGFVMYFLKLDLISLIPMFLTEGKLDYYKEAADIGLFELTPPYLNPFFLAKCIILYLFLYYYDFIVESNKFAPILINVFAASILFLLSMSTISVLASRVSDLYGIVDCVIFSYCIYLVSPRYITRIAIAIVGLYMLVHNMFFTEYFT